MACPACGRDYTPDCVVCLRGPTLEAVRLTTPMPWPTHRPQWTSGERERMICAGCGIDIPPGSTVGALLGPCSAGEDWKRWKESTRKEKIHLSDK